MITVVDAIRLIDRGSALATSSAPGVRITLEPADLAARIEDDVDLVLGGHAASVRAGSSMFARLPDGQYPAALVGSELEVELRGPITVSNGQGVGRLRAVNRERQRITVLVQENGVRSAFRGEVVFLIGSDGARTIDTRAVADDQGIVEVELRPDHAVVLCPASHLIDRVAQGWETVDSPLLPVNGQSRVILRRAWNLRLSASTDLAGHLITAAGPALRDARFNAEGHAHLFLPPGSYDLLMPDRKVDPLRIEVGTGEVHTQLRTEHLAVAQPDVASTLTVRLELPADAVPEGLIELVGPNGTAITHVAESRVDVGRVAPGRYVARLWGHATLDAEAKVDVRPGDAAEMALVAAPGDRSRWRVIIPGAETVWLRTADWELPLGDAEHELLVPSTGPARALIQIGEDLLISPVTDSGGDANFHYVFGGSVVCERRTLLIYPDGWSHEAVAGPTRVRLGEARVIVRDGRQYRIAEVVLREGDTISSTIGSLADRAAVDAILRR